MPYRNKNSNKVFQDGYINSLGSKTIIPIEQTTVLLIFAFAIFKIASFLWPQNVVQLYSLPALLLSFSCVLRTYDFVFVGALLSFITWHVMYFDSAVPGVNPPTPLSPAMYRTMSGADFHLNYVFALLIGSLATVMLYV